MVVMGMVWPWRQQSKPIFSGGWPGSRWLALLERDRPSAAGREPHHAGAYSAGKAGNSEFEAFFLRYDRQITGYLWRMTGDDQTASELAQETFLRAWQHFDMVSHYDQPLSWLFRVATNLARQHHRRAISPIRTTVTFDEDTDPASSDPTVHFAEQDLVRQTLLKLSIQQRAALILREVYGLSCDEVGSLLNISRDAVKMALWRAREQFRTHYLREEEDAR
jgi:RNA polymerase sigma-70 factor, ECF subfamily